MMGCRRSFFTLTLALVGFLLGLGSAMPAAAHPLGNFTVNQYSRIEIGTEEARLVYVLDLAELPTVADRALIDADGDGAMTAAEREQYLEAKLGEIVPQLHLTAGFDELPLHLDERSLTFLPSQAGLDITRVEAMFTAALPDGVDKLSYRNDYATDRLGWREIVAVNGQDVHLEGAAELAADRSNELRAYPDDLLSSPLDERSLTVSYAIVPGTAAASADAELIQPGPADVGQQLSALVNGGDLTTTGTLLALIAAAAWGAMHALSPGHGKTVVGAYLVGSRGTPRHALFLGLTVTITHTAGVLALGLLILFASQTIVPERLYPWLSLTSGLLVAVLGLTILRQRLRGLPTFGHHRHDHEHSLDHDHGHDHLHVHSHDGHLAHDHDHEYAHAHGLVHSHGGHTHSHLPPEQVTWRSLLALGISGGILPCPSALLALLGAVAVGRAGFGLLVVIAFSLGLAATLTGIGLLFLYAGRLLERRASAMPGRLTGLVRFAPAAAALAVTASGLLIVARAVLELQRM